MNMKLLKNLKQKETNYLTNLCFMDIKLISFHLEKSKWKYLINYKMKLIKENKKSLKMKMNF